MFPFAPSCVVLNDPDLHEEVSVRKPLPVHPLGDEVMTPVVGTGVIITSNGALWKRLHNMMMPAFSWKHIRDITGIMIEDCNLFRKALEEKAGTGASFSMMDLGGKLVFDIIARAVFNRRLHAQTSGSRY